MKKQSKQSHIFPIKTLTFFHGSYLITEYSTVAGEEAKCSFKVQFSLYSILIIINQPFLVPTSILFCSFLKRLKATF